MATFDIWVFSAANHSHFSWKAVLTFSFVIYSKAGRFLPRWELSSFLKVNTSRAIGLLPLPSNFPRVFSPQVSFPYMILTLLTLRWYSTQRQVYSAESCAGDTLRYSIVGTTWPPPPTSLGLDPPDEVVRAGFLWWWQTLCRSQSVIPSYIETKQVATINDEKRKKSD